MSTQTSPNDKPIIVVADPSQTQPEPVVKQSVWSKTKQFVKSHKKPTIAVGALLGLVGLAAVAGRKTAPTPDFSQPLELESSDPDNEETVEEVYYETPVA